MKFKSVKGSRDFLPEEMILRQQVIDKIRFVFETYGFQPLESSAIENWEILSAKGAGGEEILKETYNFEDKAGRKVGLRYDLTVPLARIVASNPSLPLPFKRYQIEKVWRYGDVAKGRLREFLQADIDTVGSENMLADAEIIACTISVFNELGFKKFLVRLNNRKTLSALMKYAGINEDKIIETLRSVDKLDKIGESGVRKELQDKEILEKSIEKILGFIKIKGTPEEVLKQEKEILKDSKDGKEGIDELEQLISYLKTMDVEKKYEINLSLARGLDYYTGPIFEVVAEEGIGSIAGGGRYDKMIGLFLGRNIPATGISFGIERIIEVMKEKKMLKQIKSKNKVFIVAINDDVRKKSLEITQMLRNNKISADFDTRNRKLSRQLEYAGAIGIPYTVIVGQKELSSETVKVRNMETGNETKVKIKNLVNYLSKI